MRGEFKKSVTVGTALGTGWLCVSSRRGSGGERIPSRANPAEPRCWRAPRQRALALRPTQSGNQGLWTAVIYYRFGCAIVARGEFRKSVTVGTALGTGWLCVSSRRGSDGERIPSRANPANPRCWRATRQSALALTAHAKRQSIAAVQGLWTAVIDYRFGCEVVVRGEFKKSVPVGTALGTAFSS